MTKKDSILLKAHHCGISVPDLDAAIKWYTDKLGFSLTNRMTIDDIGAEIAFIKHGDFEIELFKVAGAASLPDGRLEPNTDIKTHGTKHIAFVVDNLEQTAKILKKSGVDFAMEMREMPDGKVIFIRDNSGVLIEIIEKFS